MPTLRLGSIAPDFEAQTTKGPIKFHEWIGDSWAILFSHPDDFTPVCTTELAEVSLHAPDFEKRGVKVIGLSANDLGSHERWIHDINEWGKTDVQFPIIADHDRKVATTYDMLDYQDATNVDKKGLPFTKVIRLTISYPAATGRSFDEILRLQGDNVIVHPSVSTEDAKKLFNNVVEHKPYLRTASYPA
ncbi:1-Cys peroxiredoxin [Lactarius quietus]|nr:1-Cys peroxiredoxin [Lactarius quietus]